MLCFSGKIEHQIDDKGRVRIPAKFLAKSAEGASPENKNIIHYCMMACPQGNIAVYLADEMEKKIMELRATPETSDEVTINKRIMLGSSEEVETDSQGRVVIPPHLRAHAQIVKDLVTTGMDNRFEIWAKEVYDRVNGNVTVGTAGRALNWY